MGVLHLTSENFDEAVKSGRTLVDFWASWCMPCKMVGPIIEELAVEYENRATIAKVEVDSARKIAIRYAVLSVPTVILFEDGVEAQRFVGVQPKEVYKQALDG